MAVTTTEAIASTTAAATAGSDIDLGQGESAQVWLDGDLGMAEWVRVYRVNSGDTIEVPAHDHGGPIILGSGRQSVFLNGPGIFRLKKSVTASAIAVLYDA